MNMSAKHKSKTELLFVVGAGLATLLAVVVSMSQQSTFRSSWWRSANLTTQTRNHMVQDLINSRVLLGKRREQVIELLGPVTQTDKLREWDMVYVLGPQDGYIDDAWLVLRTDKSGNVVEQKVTYD